MTTAIGLNRSVTSIGIEANQTATMQAMSLLEASPAVDTDLVNLRTPSKKVLVSFPRFMLDVIDRKAQAEGRTRSDLIREATRRYLGLTKTK